MLVTKRNNTKEPLDSTKLLKNLQWAKEGLTIDLYDIILKAQLQFFDGIKTSDIHKRVTETVKDEISLKNFHYDKMYARLLLHELYRVTYKDNTPAHLRQILTNPKFDTTLLKTYETQLDELNSYIDHSRDFLFTGVGIEQMRDKYLVKNKTTKEFFETPQVAFMLIAMAGYQNMREPVRSQYVKDLYDALSLFKVSLPTPIMENMRTPRHTYASCAVISQGDTLQSWASTYEAGIRLATTNHGLGWDKTEIRSKGSDVANGKMSHYGFFPTTRATESIVMMTKQGSRNGAATESHKWWDSEIMDILTVASTRNEESKRIKNLNYSILMNDYLYSAYQADETVSLFSTSTAPDLLDAMRSADDTEFKRVDMNYHCSDKPKITISARDLVDTLVTQRTETGQLYLVNIDTVARQNRFKTPIRSSNLCQEILLPTSPLGPNDEGEVAICLLSNINIGNAELSEFPHLARLLVRLLDEAIDLTTYEVSQAKKSTINRRSLGIGANNLAYLLAKHGYKYGSPEALGLVHKTFEQIQYSLLKASNELAQEKGPCNWFGDTIYSDGYVPIDKYEPVIDSLVKPTYHCNWEELRHDIAKYGLRNSVLSAIPPSESSSQISNSTSGLEPVKDALLIKDNGKVKVKQIIPGYPKLVDNYDFAFSRDINLDYLKTMAVVQKWIDQSISTSTFSNESKPSRAKLTKGIFQAKKLGIKSLYYYTAPKNTDLNTHCAECSV